MSRITDPAPAPASEDTPRRPVRRHRTGTAILAIAAGTALLLGGGGTYAYWSTQTALTAGPVQSGDLNLSLGTGSWTLAGALRPAAAVTNLANVRLVPGDVLTLTQPITVTLVGDTIAADLATTLGPTFTSGSLANYLDVQLTVPGLGTATGTNTYRITGATQQTVDATLRITFRSSTDLRNGVNGSVNLNGVSFTLTQASS